MSPSLRPDQTGARADPVRAVRRAALLVEELLLDPVRVALQGQRPRPQVRQQDRRDPRVVVDHVALREPGARVHQLVEVRQRDRRVADVDLDALGGRHACDRSRAGSSARLRRVVPPKPFRCTLEDAGEQTARVPPGRRARHGDRRSELCRRRLIGEAAAIRLSGDCTADLRRARLHGLRADLTLLTPGTPTGAAPRADQVHELGGCSPRRQADHPPVRAHARLESAISRSWTGLSLVRARTLTRCLQRDDSRPLQV